MATERRCRERWGAHGAWEPPFAHCFRTRANAYVYDVNSNHIVTAEREFWHALKRLSEEHSVASASLVGRASWGQSAAACDAWALDTIDSARTADGLFLPNRPPRSPYRVQVTDIEDDYVHGLSHLMLCVTLECNMRCTYCVHSDQYPQYPAYANHAMTWHTARRALDYFISRARSHSPRPTPYGKGAAVSFYGGEPLVEFGLIRRCVEYVEAVAPGRFGYGITTNGTLLDTEAADFVAQNNFILQVSVDGPREVHDVKRRFASGGGTLQVIMSNLQYIRQTYPAYYTTHVGFSIVHDPANTPVVADFLAASQLTPPRVRVSQQLTLPDSDASLPAGEHADTEVADEYSRLLEIAETKRLRDFSPSEKVASGLWAVEDALHRLCRRAVAAPSGQRTGCTRVRVCPALQGCMSCRTAHCTPVTRRPPALASALVRRRPEST